MTVTSTAMEHAVRQAAEQGRAELLRLDQITDDLIAEFARMNSDRVDSDPRIEDLSRGLTRNLRRHLDRERDSLGSFNIAFFGRTGAGKSTLLSAFGQLDGEYVSPGASDWTTDVHHVQWHGCRLFDTPGINGWGRTESREDLETKARRAVEIADIVLLCFDSQSQQAMEFSKIASWIQTYGKPSIAVLNVRNSRWRHPAKVAGERRRGLSESVSQHADNIRGELAQIGLRDTPVVAIHSQRALFARATTPFNGPAATGFAADRAAFGVDYLSRWSNFSALERLITAAISEGGGDLRLAALRDDVRARCLQAAQDLKSVAAECLRDAEAFEREVESLLAVLGYPSDDERVAWLRDADRDCDLLEASEQARDNPYTSPTAGTLDDFVAHLATSHLAACRRASRSAADALIEQAFAKGTKVDSQTFAAAVYDADALQAAVETVWTDRSSFLKREIEIAADQSPPSREHDQAHGASVLGDAGTGIAGDLLRGSGIAVGLGAVAVPFAIANAWNPAGWAVGAAVVGVGIAGQVQQFFGKRMSDREKKAAQAARAQAIGDAQQAVNQSYDDYEEALVSNSRSQAWKLLAPALLDSLRRSLDLRDANKQALEFAGIVLTSAQDIAATPPVADVLARAQRGLAPSPAEVSRLLLGEDWIEDGTAHTPVSVDPRIVQLYSGRRSLEQQALSHAVRAAWQAPPVDFIRHWRDDIEDAASGNAKLLKVAQSLTRVSRTRPAFTVLGDYNAGKSSLIRRILTEYGAAEPADRFDIRAQPSTTDVVRYAFPRFDLLDTPGMQSGDPEHSARALDALTESALIFVVVHVNLMIGDTSLLESVIAGSGTLAPKGSRIVFLINRSDELGIDPLSDPEGFLNLQDRKRDELRAALAARGVDTTGVAIHCLSGDPFGLTGGIDAVAPDHYEENRLWDGVSTLTDTIAGLTDTQFSAASHAAAFDTAVTELKEQRAVLHAVEAGLEAQLEHSAPVITTLTSAVADAVVLQHAFEEHGRRVIDAGAAVATAAIYATGPDDIKQMNTIVSSWWTDPVLVAQLDAFLTKSQKKVDQWCAQHWSAIDREVRAAEFAQKLSATHSFHADGNTVIGAIAGGTGTAAGTANKFAKVLGNRDAVYAIGKQFGHKFKPWGAVKGGARVAKVGAVLGVVAAAADAASMANDKAKAKGHIAQQDAAAANVEENAAALLKQLLLGADEDGPVSFLQTQVSDFNQAIDKMQDDAAKIQDELTANAAELAVVEKLLHTAAELTGSTTSESPVHD